MKFVLLLILSVLYSVSQVIALGEDIVDVDLPNSPIRSKRQAEDGGADYGDGLNGDYDYGPSAEDCADLVQNRGSRARGRQARSGGRRRNQLRNTPQRRRNSRLGRRQGQLRNQRRVGNQGRIGNQRRFGNQRRPGNQRRFVNQGRLGNQRRIANSRRNFNGLRRLRRI